MRVGPEFLDLRNHIKTNLKQPMSDCEITDEIALFLKERGIHDAMVRRANLKFKGGFLR